MTRPVFPVRPVTVLRLRSAIWIRTVIAFNSSRLLLNGTESAPGRGSEQANRGARSVGRAPCVVENWSVPASLAAPFAGAWTRFPERTRTRGGDGWPRRRADSTSPWHRTGCIAARPYRRSSDSCTWASEFDAHDLSRLQLMPRWPLSDLRLRRSRLPSDGHSGPKADLVRKPAGWLLSR